MCPSKKKCACAVLQIKVIPTTCHTIGVSIISPCQRYTDHLSHKTCAYNLPYKDHLKCAHYVPVFFLINNAPIVIVT